MCLLLMMKHIHGQWFYEILCSVNISELMTFHFQSGIIISFVSLGLRKMNMGCWYILYVLSFPIVCHLSLLLYLREFAPRMRVVSPTSKTSLHRPRSIKCSSRQMFLLLATTTTIRGHSIVQIWNLIKFLCHVSDENELHHYLHILARLYMIMFASIGFSNMSCTTIYWHKQNN